MEIFDFTKLTCENKYQQMQYMNPIPSLDTLIDMICPAVCGNHDIKLAYLLAMVGGNKNDKHKIKSSINSLIISNPSSAKSQISNWISDFDHPSQTVAMYGVSAPGLIGSINKRNSNFYLQPGLIQVTLFFKPKLFLISVFSCVIMEF